MSKINGDKARFNKDRKEKIHRRERTRKMMKMLANKSSETAAATPKK
jgi:hypothetical protein